jgi:hypothetical protein
MLTVNDNFDGVSRYLFSMNCTHICFVATYIICVFSPDDSSLFILPLCPNDTLVVIS